MLLEDKHFKRQEIVFQPTKSVFWQRGIKYEQSKQP